LLTDYYWPTGGQFAERHTAREFNDPQFRRKRAVPDCFDCSIKPPAAQNKCDADPISWATIVVLLNLYGNVRNHIMDVDRNQRDQPHRFVEQQLEINPPPGWQRQSGKPLLLVESKPQCGSDDRLN
jgi:hypothetical protein